MSRLQLGPGLGLRIRGRAREVIMSGAETMQAMAGVRLRFRTVARRRVRVLIHGYDLELRFAVQAWGNG